MDEKAQQLERQRILGAVKAQRNLAFDPNYISMYVKAGGALSNNAIPTVFEDTPTPAPIKQPQVQQTTTSMRTQAIENNYKLNGRLDNISTSNQNNAQNTNGQVTITRDQDNGDGTRTVTYSDGTSARVQATKNSDGSESYKELSPKEEVDYDLTYGKQRAEDKYKAEVNYANSTLDSIASQSTQANKALIESIKKTYGARIKLMEETNRRIVKAKEQAGLRTGRARYTSDSHEGVLSDEEQQGLMRVSELEGQMLSLIAKAEVARTDKDLDIFNKRMAELDDADKALQTTVQNLQKTAYDKLKLMQDERKLASDEAKALLQTNLDKSERAAPALVSAMAQFKTPEEQSKFISEYSKKTGIPLDILLGDIEIEKGKQKKSTLDIENIRNQIRNRDISTKTAQERLEFDKKKADFNPTSEQKAKVGKYLSTNGSDTDVKKAQEDPDFFYYILNLVEADEV